MVTSVSITEFDRFDWFWYAKTKRREIRDHQHSFPLLRKINKIVWGICISDYSVSFPAFIALYLGVRLSVCAAGLSWPSDESRYLQIHGIQRKKYNNNHPTKQTKTCSSDISVFFFFINLFKRRQCYWNRKKQINTEFMIILPKAKNKINKYCKHTKFLRLQHCDLFYTDLRKKELIKCIFFYRTKFKKAYSKIYFHPHFTL